MNNFKKQDSKGNKLKESIGNGVDLEHYKKVKESRAKTSIITFRCTRDEKNNFENKVIKTPELNESEVLRILVNGFVDGSIKIK